MSTSVSAAPESSSVLTRSQPIQRDGPRIIFLAFANNRVDQAEFLRNLADEQRGIRAALAPLQATGQWQIIERFNATPDDLFNVFQENRDRVAIFHFAGHANGYQLLLETDTGSPKPVFADGLSTFLGQQSALRLVVLNGCATQPQAAGLIEAGIPSIIATDSNIGDAAAQTFAVQLYQGLATGATLDVAFSEAASGARASGEVWRHVTVGFASEPRASRWPWAVYPAKDDNRSWTLGDIVADELFGLPRLPQKPLPASPYRVMSRFKEADAEVFFGRRREIRRLYNLLTSSDAAPIHLLHGQSGVGKSSLLAAGLFPFLSQKHDVVYVRRDGNPLVVVLGKALKADSRGLLDAWCRHEASSERPLTVVLDQLEEALPDSGTAHRHEFAEFRAELVRVFADQANRPKGKLVLGFRKECFPEIATDLRKARLPFGETFLQRLDRRGIIEIINGPTSSSRLRDCYLLDIEQGLAELIAESLLDDRTSQLAPVLQIILSRMWEHAVTPSQLIDDGVTRRNRRFDRDLFRRRREGLDQFVRGQIDQLRDWNEEIESSGFLLDFLRAHTTAHDTTCSLTAAALRERYPHRLAQLPELCSRADELRLIEQVRTAVPEADDEPSTRLAHDTLAPVVRELFNQSGRPGQLAHRILENVAVERSDGQLGRVLNEADLRRVEAGTSGMRAWSEHERRLIETSREVIRAEREKQELHERRTRLAIRAAAGAILIAVAIAAFQLWARWRQGRVAIANSLAVHSLAALEVGDGLASATLLGVESMRRLTELNQPTLAADTALRSSLAVLVRGDSLAQLGHRVGASAIAEHSMTVAAADGDSVRVATIGRQGPPLAFQLPKTHAIAVSPDGRFIAAAGDDSTMQVWDVVQRRRIGRPLQLPHSIQALAWSAASQVLAVLISSDSGVMLRSATDTTPFRRIRYFGVPQALATSPTGDRFATATNATLTLWSSAGPLVSHTMPNGITSLAYNSTGTCLIAASAPKGQAWIWDLGSDKIAALASPVDAVEIAADSDCSRIAFGTSTGVIKVVDRKTNETFTIVKHTERIASLRFGSDSRYLLSAAADRTIRVWRVDDAHETARMVQSDAVSHATFTDDSTVLAVSADGNVRLWHLRSSAYEWRDDVHRRIRALAFAPSGDAIAAGGEDGSVHFWNTSDGRRGTIFHSDRGVEALAFLPGSDQIMVGGLTGAIRLSPQTGDTLPRWADEVTSLSIDSTGRIAVGRADGSVVVTSESRADSTVFVPASDDQVIAVALTRDGSSILAATLSGAVQRWRASDHTLLDSTHVSGVNALAFDNRGHWIAVAREDSGVLLRALPNGSAMRLGPPRAVTAVAFTPDGDYLAAGGRDGRVQIWDVAEAREIGRVLDRDGVEAVAFSPSGRYLATGTAAGIVTLWTWRPTDLIESACAILRGVRVGDADWHRYTGESTAPVTCPQKSK